MRRACLAPVLPLLAACGGLLVACNGRESAPSPGQVASLEEGVAARVGDEVVETELVVAIARAQSVTPAAARELAISDALFAAHARASLRGLGVIESAERAALARAVLEDIRQRAIAAGPPTDAEVEEITRARWLDLARPPMARTIHAVVRVEDPSERERAKAVAQRLARALEGVSDPSEFEKRAKAFDAEGLKLTVEHLLPVGTDGRVATPNTPPGSEPMRFDLAFARAANAIDEPGEQSPVVEGEFGYHVILLLEKIPENRPTLEQRRAAVRREVVQRRGAALEKELVERVRGTRAIELSSAADSLVMQVQVAQ